MLLCALCALFCLLNADSKCFKSDTMPPQMLDHVCVCGVRSAKSNVFWLYAWMFTPSFFYVILPLLVVLWHSVENSLGLLKPPRSYRCKIMRQKIHTDSYWWLSFLSFWSKTNAPIYWMSNTTIHFKQQVGSWIVSDLVYFIFTWTWGELICACVRVHCIKKLFKTLGSLSGRLTTSVDPNAKFMRDFFYDEKKWTKFKSNQKN